MDRLTRKHFRHMNSITLITNVVTARLPGDSLNIKSHLQKLDFFAEKVHFLRHFVYIERVAGQPSGHDIRDLRGRINLTKVFWSRSDHF